MRRKYVRVGFTAAQCWELWDRWRKVEGLNAIGPALGKPSSCIFNHLRPTDGIGPAERKRSRLALTLAEREEISRVISVRQSVRSMAECVLAVLPRRSAARSSATADSGFKRPFSTKRLSMAGLMADGRSRGDAIFWRPLIVGADISLLPQFLLRRFGGMGPWF